jgi:hypothetical protein
MSRILAVKGAAGEKEVDYSALSSKEIDKKIKTYEKNFGSFAKFLRQYDCESSPCRGLFSYDRLGVSFGRAESQETYKTFSHSRRKKKASLRILPSFPRNFTGAKPDNA